MSDKDSGSHNSSSECSNDSLNGSWVKLDESFKNGPDRPFSIHNDEMENLLAEAVDERGSISIHSQRQSLRSSTSEERLAKNGIDTQQEVESTTKLSENVPNQNWIEQWASRVEQYPPKKWRLTYPHQKPNDKFKKMVESSKRDHFHVNLYMMIPTLVLTHILALGIGLYIGRKTSSGGMTV